MKILKLMIKSSSFISLMLLAVTGSAYAALFLIVSASMSLGIMLGENMDGARK